MPFFYFLRDHTDPVALIATLEEKNSQAEMGEPHIWQQTVAQLVAEVCASDAIEAAREEAKPFLKRAQASLTPLPDNNYKQSIRGCCYFDVQPTEKANRQSELV